MYRHVRAGAVAAVLILASSGAFAMKPAPFETVTYVDPATKIRLVSTPEDGMARGTTRVFDAKRKELWSMHEIVGRYRVQLSPDGSMLLLTGNFYFGTSFHVTPDEPVALVYERGKLVKKLTFADVSKIDPETSATERKLPVMGGNWVGLTDFVTSVDVDWQKRTVSVRVFDGSVAERAF
jgi:hypothetical protein